ncbi:IQ domain-containing protein E [Strongylocentrotus purpuratus]|uniref:Uncharacterized protein n=1 Tax=Strongylocentrotus purpuratus TaxID=7668 RepID=A0A7M7NSK0_STRPU|nr:IQ domain-containing protein E [Strongylocentrotus purpuratus]
MPTIPDFHSKRSTNTQQQGVIPSRRPGSAKGKKGAGREKPPSPYLVTAGSKKHKSKSSHAVGSKTPTGLKSAREYWLDGLKSGKGGLTGCSKSSNYLGVPKKAPAFSSTSDYLKETVLNMHPRKSSKSRAMVSDPIHRNMKGVPSYKPQEEMYDEILDLKKQVNALRAENDMVKAKNQRFEDDLVKKERQIDQLLDPTKSDLRNTLNSRQPDSAAKVNSLKQRNLKLEMNLKDKEAELMKLKNDMKGTRMEEMKVAMESFYQEVQRLRYQQSHQTGKATRPGTAERDSSNSTAKVKALNGTILRLTESNQRLQSENKLLKQDLERTLYESSAYNGPARSEKSQRDYEDLNRRELLAAVVNLQQKMDHIEGKGMRKDRHADGEMPGKIPLTGSLSDRLDQLDKRETELLKEKGRLEKDVSRLREDKTKFRQKVEQFEDENKALQKENERLKEQAKSMTPRQNGSMKRHPSSESLHSKRSDRHGDRYSDRQSDRHNERQDRSSERQSERQSDRRSDRQSDRQSDRRSDRQDRSSDRQSDRHSDRYSDRHSDKHSDRHGDRHSDKHSDRYSDRHSDKHSDRLSDRSEKRSRANSSASSRRKQREEEEELRDRERRLEELRQNRSARTLQKGWRAHKQREQDRGSDLDEAATTIQAAMRGHHRRKDLLDRFNSEPFSPSTTDAASDRVRDDEDSDDYDDAAMTIQSAARGHWSRKEQLSKFSNRSDSEPESARSFRSGKSSKAGSTKSGLDRFMSGSRPGSKAGSSSRAGSVRNGSNVLRKDPLSEEDSDDSLVMSTTSKKSSVSKYSNKSGNKGKQTNNSFSSKTSSTNPRQAQRLTSSIPEEDSSDDDDDIVVTVKPNKPPSTTITTTNTSVKAKSKRFGFF